MAGGNRWGPGLSGSPMAYAYVTVPRWWGDGRSAGERYAAAMERDEATDEELAVRRFNQKERFKLLRDGMPIEAIRMLRQGYVREVLANPEALRQLRAGFDLGEKPYVTKTGKVLSDAEIEALSAEAERGYAAPYCSIYCEHNADGECPCEPCVFIRTHGFSGHLTGCPYGGRVNPS